ncbi:MAG: DUF5686 family protein, partial [Prevotellaceae bacterium]|nr:DUF5686 family protein [Prevotellaceae bacterium]
PEIFVLPGSNPAVELIKRVGLARKANDVSKFPAYKVQNTEENLIFLSKNNKKGKNKRIWEMLKSGNLSASDSAMLAPLYMAEKTFRVTSSGRTELSNNIFSSDETAGKALLQFTAQLSGGMNFYDNSLPLFGKSIVSPLANVGASYYKYYLTDSLPREGGGKTYEILFRSVNRKNLAFDGRLWVDSASLALTAVEAVLPPQANINFVNNFSVEQRFEPLSEQLWAKRSEQLTLNLTYEIPADSFPEKAHLLLKQKSFFSPLDTEVLPQADFAGAGYSRELIDEKLKALGEDPVFRSAMRIADAALTGYVKIGKIDLGKIQQILRVTGIEGWRWNIPLRTNEDLWKNGCIGGYAGYGFRNREIKYSAYALFRLPKAKQRHIFGVGYTDDYRRTDYNYNDFIFRENPLLTGDEDFSTSILTLSSSPKLNERQEFWLSYTRDWKRNIEGGMYIRSVKQLPNDDYLPFFLHDRQAVNSLQNLSITASLRFSFGEQHYDDHLQRIYIPNRLPVIYLTTEYGHYHFKGGKGDYGKLSAVLKQNLRFASGQWKYMLQADQVWGALPYPLLVFPHGSETPGYHPYRFSLMGYMDYAADRNIQFHNELTFNGILFNSIPLVNRLNLRERCSFKINYGRLGDSHKRLFDYPNYMNPANSPYAEFGIGIANILRVLSIQSIWATSNLFTFENLRWSPRLYLSIDF